MRQDSESSSWTNSTRRNRSIGPTCAMRSRLPWCTTMRECLLRHRTFPSQVGHGQSVTITYVRVKNYHDSAIRVVELIDEQCNK